MASVARATTEQASMSEQIARAVEDMRARARELATTTAQQARSTAHTAGEVKEVTTRLTQLTRMHNEQVEHLARLNGVLGGGWRPEGKSARVLEPA
jgi:methyl-accepting chemotaxis protein